MERAENLARILDVNATFARDRRGGQDWLPVVQINADQARFTATHGSASPGAVLRFYIADTTNPTSIISAVRAARENARALRPLIPNEAWGQINRFYNRMRALDAGALAPGNLARLLGWIRECCQTHAGILDGTMYRDQAWHFYLIGRWIERADQITRLLDIKYHTLLPSSQDVGSPLDLGQWNVLLRSAGGYHAYRRIDHGGITLAGVAGLLLLDPRFSRSVALCVAQADMLQTELVTRHGLAGAGEAASGLAGLRTSLETATMERVLADGLHEFLDLVQRHLIAITDGFSAAYFGFVPPTLQAQAEDGQQQRQ